jgi:hypothetical protein
MMIAHVRQQMAPLIELLWSAIPHRVRRLMAVRCMRRHLTMANSHVRMAYQLAPSESAAAKCCEAVMAALIAATGATYSRRYASNTLAWLEFTQKVLRAAAETLERERVGVGKEAKNA